ncbi:unknown [Clostridium sp. CAG:413]|jgi:hypothetical protein|nr:unknown [Clostridium sp. CAG:413]
MDKKRFSLSLIDGFVMGIVCLLLCEFSVSAYAVELSVRAMWLIAAACAVISAIVLLFTLPKNADGRLIARLTLAEILGFALSCILILVYYLSFSFRIFPAVSGEAQYGIAALAQAGVFLFVSAAARAAVVSIKIFTKRNKEAIL